MLKTETIVIIVLIVIALLFLYRKQEILTLSEEAVQNISSIYADTSGTVIWSSIPTPGTLCVNSKPLQYAVII